MELEGSFFDSPSVVINMIPSEASTSQQAPPITQSVALQIEQWERRIRNFNLTPPQVVYRHRLPERSQSYQSFVNNDQMSCSISNKLGAQQGIVRRMRKLSRTEDTANLTEGIRKPRSRSADSRFSHRCTARRENSGKSHLDRSKIMSTARRNQVSEHAPMSDVRIQINGEGVEI